MAHFYFVFVAFMLIHGVDLTSIKESSSCLTSSHENCINKCIDKIPPEILKEVLSECMASGFRKMVDDFHKCLSNGNIDISSTECYKNVKHDGINGERQPPNQRKNIDPTFTAAKLYVFEKCRFDCVSKGRAECTKDCEEEPSEKVKVAQKQCKTASVLPACLARAYAGGSRRF